MSSSPQETLRRSVGSTSAATPSPRVVQPVNIEWYGGRGDGLTNNTVPFALALATLSNGGTLSLPPGIYLTDSVALPSRSIRVVGEIPGGSTLSNGVQIKCRSACTNFFTIAAQDCFVERLYINGNGLATNTFRPLTPCTDLEVFLCTIDGCVSGGSNVLIDGGGVIIESVRFNKCYFNGSLGKLSCYNMRVQNTQTLKVGIDGCKFFCSNPAEVLYHLYVPLGGIVGHDNFFGGLDDSIVAGTQDVHFQAGNILLSGTRSESQCASFSQGQFGNVTLVDYVHAATIAYLGFRKEVTATGTTTLLGGLFTNILVNANSGFVAAGAQLYAGGAYSGTYADYVHKIGPLTNLLRTLTMVGSAESVPGAAVTTLRGAPYNWLITGLAGTAAGGILFNGTGTNPIGLLSFNPSDGSLIWAARAAAGDLSANTLITMNTSGQLIFNNTAFIQNGTVTPEGVVTAPGGSLFMYLNGASSRLYVKQTDGGNTGWSVK